MGALEAGLGQSRAGLVVRGGPIAPADEPRQAVCLGFGLFLQSQAEVGVRQVGNWGVRCEVSEGGTESQAEYKMHVFCEPPSQWLEDHFRIGEHQSPQEAKSQPVWGVPAALLWTSWGTPAPLNLSSDWFTLRASH